MNEVVNEEIILFNILEELYELNHSEWKKRVIEVLMKEDTASYFKIKEKFIKIPDMLVYRCLRELMLEGMIVRESDRGKVSYRFTEEGKTLAPILADVEE